MKHLCIISLTPIAKDSRVLRQVQYLSQHFQTTVVGFGEPHPSLVGNPRITWHAIPQPFIAALRPHGLHLSQLLLQHGGAMLRRIPAVLHAAGKSLWQRNSEFLLQELHPGFLLLLGWIFPRLYDHIYWRNTVYGKALEFVLASKADIIYANEWNTLPIARQAASTRQTKIVLDLHEYYPSMYDNVWIDRLRYPRYIAYHLRQSAHLVDASITVSQGIAERYASEFALHPLVIYNAPEYVETPAHAINADRINLIYHGSPNPDRKLERIIDATALCAPRYHLHMMLTTSTPEWLDSLKCYADKVAPRRVTFHEAVSPQQVVTRIADFDILICLIYPSNFNYLVCMPNKLFEAMMAGLAVCTGPIPSMAAFVREHQVGFVTPSFSPADIAAQLNALTVNEIEQMRTASRTVSHLYHAESELGKVVSLLQSLSGEVEASPCVSNLTSEDRQGASA